jgi:tripartite-type tricarboxylate transporter receptor subunit TctC
MKLRTTGTLLAAFAAVSICHGAFAQSYPTKPIKLIVPSAPGAVGDITSRIVATRLSQVLGQPVIIDNRPGAGGRIGPADVAHSPPDGYTLLWANAVGMAVFPATTRKLAYDPIKDFVPVAELFSYATTLVCNPAVPVKSVQDLIDYARKNPGKVTYASAGIGSGNHFTNALFNSMAGVETLHVPFNGSAPALQAVVAGNVMCTDLGAAKPAIDSGRVRALATTGMQRDPRFPDLPTLDESGLKGFGLSWWQGIMAPAKTPPAVLRRLEQALRETMQDPDVVKRAYDVGQNVSFADGPSFGKVMTRDIDMFKGIAKTAGISLDD